MSAAQLKASLFLIGASVLLAACGDDAAPAGGEMPPVPVTVVTLATEPVTLTRELPGRAAASLVAEVRPQVSGIVKARLFEEGSVVEAGQVLYELDDATYQADVDSARAALARARATLDAARLTAARSAELARVEAISAQDNENAAAALSQAEADVAVARAALARAEVMLGYARISAPISGRIGKSSVTQGALVTANQAEPLATIHQLDPMHVDLTPSSASLLEMRRELAAGRLSDTRDLPVTIRLEDGTAYPHPGRLSFADLTVDPGTGSFSIRVVVPNPDQLLLPGSYLRAEVGAGRREQALLVPQQAVQRDARGNTSVWVVGDDELAQPREIVVSRTFGDRWLVESGLAAGERVIVAGLQKVQPGVRVAAGEAAAAAR